VVTIAGMYSFERAWGSFGSATGQMNGPQALAVNAQGLVYVADAGNNRIQIFDSMGQYNGEFGDSLLNQPWDIAIEDSFVYVATNGNQNIYEFTLSGTFLSKISLPSNTLFPQIGVDSNFNVYAVASANSGQILVYNKSGVQSQMLNISTSICGNVDLLGTTLFAYSTSDSLILARSLANGKQDTIPLGFGSVPIDIAGDSSHIFVLNRPTPNKGIVSTYNKELEFIGKWGGNISYIQVSSIAADLNGHIYILDEDNQKISQFRKAN